MGAATARAAREWRRAHEREIVEEYFSFLRVPNVSGDAVNATIEDILGVRTISVPIANDDNNQHSANENIRRGHFWDGIETQAALLMGE